VGAACEGAFSVVFNVLLTFVKVVQSAMLSNSIAYPADRRVIQQAKVGEIPGLSPGFCRRGGAYKDLQWGRTLI